MVVVENLDCVALTVACKGRCSYLWSQQLQPWVHTQEGGRCVSHKLAQEY